VFTGRNITVAIGVERAVLAAAADHPSLTHLRGGGIKRPSAARKAKAPAARFRNSFARAGCENFSAADARSFQFATQRPT